MGLNKSCLFNAARYSILDMEYGVQISGIGGWGAELNREIVSCRACVRAVCMSSESGAEIYGLLLSLFPFDLRRSFLSLERKREREEKRKRKGESEREREREKERERERKKEKEGEREKRRKKESPLPPQLQLALSVYVCLPCPRLERFECKKLFHTCWLCAVDMSSTRQVYS